MAEFEKIDPNARPDVAEMPDLSTAQKVPGVQIDRSKILDVYGNPLQYGKNPNDTHILGPDDAVPTVTRAPAPGSLRDHTLYPSIFPAALFLAEERYVVPFGMYVAKEIVDVDLIDEMTYQKLQKQIRERSIFCVLDISTPVVHSGMVQWPGFRIMCKEFEVAAVNFKLNVSTGTTITTHVRLWESKHQRYTNLGDQHLIVDLTREKAATILDNYLYQEQILK